MRRVVCLLLVLMWLPEIAGQREGKIMRPEDGSALPSGNISIVAGGPAGRLELDGQPIKAEEPFPEVFHAKLAPLPGQHTLVFLWQGGRQEIRLFTGGNPPSDFRPFRNHPATEIECTQCHGLSSRGRFRFTGGCFNCHQQEAFVNSHQHAPHVLEQCGQCHNAHGSTAKALLILSREKACKLCHN